MQNEQKTNRMPGRNGKRLLIWTLGATLLAQPILLAVPAFASADNAVTAAATTGAVQAAVKKLAQTNSEMITSGAKRIDYTWVSKAGATPSKVHVIEVDLTNPYVKLDVMNGKVDSVSSVSSVGNMVSKYGAVAGVNGDYFNTANGKGAPIGAEVTGGQLVSSPSQLTGMYAFALTNDHKPTIDTYGFEGVVTAADGSVFPLTGINKAAYKTEPNDGFSHANAMYVYTSAWTQTRPDISDSATTPTEVLVQNGIVTQFADNKMITGPVPADGYILRTHGKAAEFARAHLQVGTQVNANYNLIAQSTGQKINPDALQMLIGGHTILVNGGAAATFSRSTSSISPNSARARTALGYTKDGAKALIITVEDSDSSQGATLAELQQMMVQLGVWKGMNLDGGGSTTMISRQLGETATQLAFPTEYGVTQRQVANGLGVFSTAPVGALKGIKASGSSVLFIGQQASYTMKAYDTYYNPVNPGTLQPSWTAGSALGSFAGNTFTAAKAGETTITVKSGTASDKLPVEIIGGASIAAMTVDASSLVLESGKSMSLPVRATLKDGRKLTVPSASVKWELRGFTGTIQDGTLTIGTVNPAAKAGYIIAHYDGFSSMAVLTSGADKKFDDFEQATYPISFQGTNGVVGTSSIVSGLPGTNSSSVVQLQYDFTNGTGTKAAYAVLNGSGRPVEGTPSGMTIDVMGDNSLNWVRAEIIDGKGDAHLITLAKQMDWNGWKTIKVNLAAEGLSAPVTLKRLYVASLEDGQDERLLTGTIAFDNISFQYPAVVPEPPRTRVDLKLGSKNAVVGGQPVKLDVAPLLLDGTTYLPLRFVTEAMGAQIDWDPVLKRVSMLRGGQFMEMVVGSKDFVLTGVRKQSEVAPIMRSGRTLVPIRLVSEQLGLVVNWDGKLGTITVE
ncbi:stalk domain-containing protein [Paenibacillus sacheonensis]|uniref:Copper amine oxidase n=1 Tax=Paenibacillus sacheonensis TaxID=742054 RepID=A0A7X4YVX5_9BACL|nr:stalk domain-containing protein [Paenibacillus sacheonensis]MBM7566489.1 exopolysaccharide biosynthesis protein [Paenibacillus sacheonensis]NBC73567.1 copper amine oxidase [Paenibacillus sacheonensis]